MTRNVDSLARSPSRKGRGAAESDPLPPPRAFCMVFREGSWKTAGAPSMAVPTDDALAMTLPFSRSLSDLELFHAIDRALESPLVPSGSKGLGRD